MEKRIGIRLYKRLISGAKLPIITFLDPNRTATISAHKQLGFKTLKKVKNAYGLKDGLEGGHRLLVILK